MFGKGHITALVFSCCELVVQIHAGTSRFLASKNMLSASNSTPSNTTEAEQVCKLWCRDDNSPGAADARAMCEWDSCKGCPECEIPTTTLPPHVNSLGNLQAEGKLPGDGQDKSSEGHAGECTGGPDCPGKDFESCGQMHSQGMCKWETSNATIAPSVGSSSNEGKVCKPVCRDHNLTFFPGATNALSMCERDSCKGCPECEILSTPTPVPIVALLSNAEGKMPGDGQDKFSESNEGECRGGPDCFGKDFGSCERRQAQSLCKWATSTAMKALPADSTLSELVSSTTPAASPAAQSSDAAVRFDAFAGVFVGSVVAIVLH